MTFIYMGVGWHGSPAYPSLRMIILYKGSLCQTPSTIWQTLQVFYFFYFIWKAWQILKSLNQILQALQS